VKARYKRALSKDPHAVNQLVAQAAGSSTGAKRIRHASQDFGKMLVSACKKKQLVTKD